MKNWMIEPNYTKNPSVAKIELDGRVIIFGSGKLTHEEVFFDFANATEIRCFDPLYKSKIEIPAKTDERWGFFSDLDTAISDGNFSSAVALFSLHYEPSWIQTFAKLLRAIVSDGKFYFAEDHGFRAVLDGTEKNSDDYPIASYVHEVFKQRHYPSGETSANGSPWLPGIRASDYKQLINLLFIFGFREQKSSILGIFRRQLGEKNLQDEAKVYLPWKSGSELLSNTQLDHGVEERVQVFQYQRYNLVTIPDQFSFLSEEPSADLVRNLVFKQATDALGQLGLTLPSSTKSDGEKNEVYSRLASFGRAWLSILYQHILRQVPQIESAQLVFRRVGDHDDMAKALNSNEFDTENTVFFTCGEVGSALEPWNYELTERYQKYREGLKELGLEFLAEKIFESGTAGVYWDGTSERQIGDPKKIGQENEFKARNVPFPCLYITAPLSDIADRFSGESKPVTLIAMIVYFRDGEELRLDDTEWRNLHSLLLPLLDNVSARVALGEMLAGHQHKKLLRERERSHKMLLKLQKPLDELTRAFGSVQAEAHEMQAILNSPEESLFRAHKLVADIFVDQNHIKISDTLTARPDHDPKDLKGPDLQMLYVLVLCSIFGRRDDLALASSLAAVLGYGRDILRDTERSPVYDDLCALVSLVTEAKKNKVSIAETIDVIQSESETDREKRQQNVLGRLKILLFEPFKNFSDTFWPKAPFSLAVESQRAKLEDLEVPKGDKDPESRLSVRHDYTPFPQYGILDYILAIKGEFENREKGHAFFLSAGFPENSEKRAVICIGYKGSQLFIPSIASNHFPFLCHAVSHGVSGRNYGNFLGAYARLLRHSHSLTTESATSNKAEWRLCDPKNSHISLAIERSDKRRFFWIEHFHSENEGTLNLVWSECGWSNENFESNIETKGGVVEAPKANDQRDSPHSKSEENPATARDTSIERESAEVEVVCFVSDHKNGAPWANALNSGVRIEGRRGIIKFVQPSIGIDNAKNVKIPPDVDVLILHTREIDSWIKQYKDKYAIVRVSTSPSSLSLPDGSPPSVTILSDVTPSYFDCSEEVNDRKLANSKLLNAVFRALDGMPNPDS